MKPNAKKFSVRRELHEIIIVRRQNHFQMFCRDCEADTDFLSLEAVNIFGFGTRKILELVDARQIHARETANGQLFLCRRSLEELQKECL